MTADRLIFLLFRPSAISKGASWRLVEMHRRERELLVGGVTLLFSVHSHYSALVAPRGAEDASSWREIETKYIFGFTTGSGIGIEGENEFTVDSIGRFGKRDGYYAATETTRSQFIQIEFGTLGSTHNIGGVTDLDNRDAAAFAGGISEFRYLALERTSNNPLSVTLAFEPNVRRIDEHVHNYEYETTVNADVELLHNASMWGSICHTSRRSRGPRRMIPSAKRPLGLGGALASYHPKCAGGR